MIFLFKLFLAKINLLRHVLCLESSKHFQQVIPHELFLPREKYFDVALLRLKSPVKLHSQIWPACLLNSKFDASLEDLSISGWDQTKEDKNLITSKVNLASKSTCETRYSSQMFFNSMPNGITDNLFCVNASDCKLLTF